ncbi:MAG: hypothetical protein AAGF12_07210 [Myxococcota bacterium]
MQAVWGRADPALKVGTFGAVVKDLVGADNFHTVGGKHFLQETDAEAIADHIAEVASP